MYSHRPAGSRGSESEDYPFVFMLLFFLLVERVPLCVGGKVLFVADDVILPLCFFSLFPPFFGIPWETRAEHLSGNKRFIILTYFLEEKNVAMTAVKFTFLSRNTVRMGATHTWCRFEPSL